MENLKSKLFVGALGLFTFASNALAEGGVHFEPGKGFTGEIDLTYFYTAVAVIILALGAIFGVKQGVRLFRV